ncbi:hypothetical protein [Streptomyces sp. NPDC002573]|uniref:hypothetical protein n=1 Tax=Streptomyces sp. NPDC002573 TaxID=3364651 RepID=UPI0036CC5825
MSSSPVATAVGFDHALDRGTPHVSVSHPLGHDIDADLRQSHREERTRNHPADDARHKPRTGRPPTFLFPDRVIATLLRLRLGLSDDTLARLMQTSPSTIVVKETRQLLKQRGHTVAAVPAPTHLPTHIPRDIPAAASNDQDNIKKAC